MIIAVLNPKEINILNFNAYEKQDKHKKIIPNRFTMGVAIVRPDKEFKVQLNPILKRSMK